MFEDHRRRTGLAAVAISTLALAGCAAGGADDGRTTVTFSYQAAASGMDVSPYKAMLDEFNASQDEITVEAREAPSETYADVVRTEILGGNASDVVLSAGGRGELISIPELMEGDHFVDLAGYDWARDLITEGLRDNYYSEGDELGGVPLDINPTVQVIVWETFQELGFDAPAETWDELLEQCRIAADAGKFMIALAGGVVDGLVGDAAIITASSVQADNPEWTQQRYDEEVTFAGDPLWEDSLEKFGELAENRCFAPSAAADGYGEISQHLLSQNAVSMFAPTGALSELESVSDFTFKLGTLPGETADGTRLLVDTGASLSVTAQSQNQEAALTFLEWWTSGEQATKFAELRNAIPIASGTLESFPDSYEFLIPFVEDPDRQVLPIQDDWPSGEIGLALGQGLQGILTGQAQPNDILTNLDAIWDRSAG